MSKDEPQHPPRQEQSAVERAVDALHEMIRRYQVDGNDRLPPEKELSERLSIGRGTLREALALLEADGLILRRRRVGTLILPGNRQWGPSGLAYPAHMILALPEFLDECGHDHEMREASFRRVQPSEAAAAALGTPEGGEVLMMSRLYAIDGQPAVLLEHLVPPLIGGREVEIHSLERGLATYLQDDMNIAVAKVESRITAEAASDEVATRLGIPPAAPLLVMYARLIAKRAGVVALGKLIFRPDVMAVTVQATDDARPATLAGAKGSRTVSIHSHVGPWTAEAGHD